MDPTRIAIRNGRGRRQHWKRWLDQLGVGAPQGDFRPDHHSSHRGSVHRENERGASPRGEAPSTTHSHEVRTEVVSMVSGTTVRDHDERHQRVRAPHHPDFATAARKLGGECDGATKTWAFEVGETEQVTELCRTTFGSDGMPGRLVAIRADLDAWAGTPKAPPSCTWPDAAWPTPRPEAARGTILAVRDVPAAHPDLVEDGIAGLDRVRDVAARRARPAGRAHHRRRPATGRSPATRSRRARVGTDPS